MKTINIFGKNMPIVAILMALLVIGTASAAVFTHYATLEGKVAIESPITVIIDGFEIPLGATYPLTIDNMTSPCIISETMILNNSHGSALDVSFLWILYEDGAPMPLNPDTSYWIFDNETVSVPVGESNFTADLEVPAYMLGDHIFLIEVNPVYS